MLWYRALKCPQEDPSMFDLFALLTLLMSLLAPADLAITSSPTGIAADSGTVQASDDGLPAPPGRR